MNVVKVEMIRFGFTISRICLGVLVCFLSMKEVHAQEQSNFTQFFLNPYIINPSYAGFDGQPSVSLFYRKQWMNIEGAPTITNLSLQAPVNSRLSMGLSVGNDAQGFFNNSSVLFSLGYHVQMNETAFVRFGLSAGGSWNTVDMNKLEVMNDPAITGMLEKNASLAGNAGVSFHLKQLHFGIALPSIFSPSYVSSDAFNVKEVKPFQAVVLNASNRFYFNDNKNIFEPYLVYRINHSLPSQFELAGVVHLNHLVWVGGSYKQDFGISGLGGVKLKNMLAIGASYSIKNSGVNELNSPSVEISLNYLFGPHKKGIPVYSFVNTIKEKEKKTTRATQEAIASRRQEAETAQKKKADALATAKQAQADKKKQQDEQAKIKKEEAARKQSDAQAKLQQDADEKARLSTQAKLQQDEANKKKQSDELARRTQATAEQKNRQDEQARIRQETKERERALADQAREQRETREKAKIKEDADRKNAEVLARQKQVDETPEVSRIPAQQSTAPTGKIPAVVQQQYEEEQLKRLASHADNPGKTIDESEQISIELRHEIVKQGNHPQELKVSEYVIVGAFRSTENASKFSEGLASLNFDTKFGYLTDKELWYVYLFKTSDPGKARAERDRVGKLFLLRDAWLLTVEP